MVTYQNHPCIGTEENQCEKEVRFDPAFYGKIERNVDIT